MSEVATIFFAILTLLCGALALGLLGFVIADRFGRVDAAGRFLREVHMFFVPLAALVAVGGVGGSIYLSQVLNFKPCLLCWIQRALLFPQAILATVLVFRRTAWVAMGGAICFAVAVIPISFYNWMIEFFPNIESGECLATGTSCAIVYVREFGFVTIPFMALVEGITLLTLYLLSISKRYAPSTSHPLSLAKDNSDG